MCYIILNLMTNKPQIIEDVHIIESSHTKIHTRIKYYTELYIVENFLSKLLKQTNLPKEYFEIVEVDNSLYEPPICTHIGNSIDKITITLS